MRAVCNQICWLNTNISLDYCSPYARSLCALWCRYWKAVADFGTLVRDIRLLLQYI
jgi:hypothetical protein